METIRHLPSRYKILETLGKGGMGQVYKAYDSLKHQICAIKIINQLETDSEDAIIKEFEILSNLQHPNLVRVYDFGFLPSEVPYFTMEFIDGSDLRTFLSFKSNLIYIYQIIKDILSALNYLHDKVTIHGDIKPENIMIIDANGFITVKLLDFGLAAHFGKKRKYISGTLRFLAPETISSQQYSPASDLYALGLTLYETITNKNAQSPLKINKHSLRSMYLDFINTFSNYGIKNPSSLDSFILNLCQPDIYDRLRSSKEALQAFSLLCEKNDILPEPVFEHTFIGRNKELSAISFFINKSSKTKKTLVIKGIQGIGKKSILRRIIKKKQLEGFLILDLSDEKYNNNPLENFINDIVDNLSEEIGNKLKKTHENLVLTQQNINTRYAESSRKDHSLVIFDNVVKYLHELSLDRPLLIIIPDIERFFEDFLRFIDHLVHEIRVLDSKILLLISRNSNIPFKYNAYESISQDTSSSTIQIEPLNERELTQLIEEYFGSLIFSRDDINDIIKKTHCIPLVIVELMRHLISSNAIVWSNNRWHFDKTAYSDIYIPKSIEELIIHKLKNLNREERYILQILAIYNEPIQLSFLVKISEINKEDIPSIVRNLKDKHFIIINNSLISLLHPTYYKYIVKNISSLKRRRINKVIAQLISKEYPNNIAKIANHYIEAKITREAFKYGLQFVDEMISRYEFHNAYNLLFDLKKLADKMDNKSFFIDIFTRLAPIEKNMGHPIDSISHYEYLINNKIDKSYNALYFKEIAMIEEDLLGHTEKAISHFNNALSQATSNRDIILEAEILLELGRLTGENALNLTKKAADIVKYINTDIYVKALSRFLFLCEFFGEDENYESIYNQIQNQLDDIGVEFKKEVLFNLYMFHFYRGDYEMAKIYTKEKIKIDEVTNDPIDKISSLSSLGGIYYVNGDFYTQIQILNDALFTSLRYKKIPMALNIISNMLIAYRYLSDYDEMLQLLDQANQIIFENKITELFSNYLLKPTYLFLILGNVKEDEYKKYLRKTKSRAKRYNNAISQGHCYLIHSKYYYQKLNFKIAYKNCIKALELFTNSNDRDDMVETYANMALYLLESGEAKTALENVDKAKSIYDEIQCKYLEPYLLFVRAVAARANGAVNTEELQTRALRTSKKMGTRETTWQIQREIALYYIDTGKLDEALSYYKDAIETIKQITESISDEKLKMSYLSVPFRKRVFDEIKNLKKQIH